MVSVRCGELVGARGAAGGHVGYLKEISVTALHTTVTITDTGQLLIRSLTLQHTRNESVVTFLEPRL